MLLVLENILAMMQLRPCRLEAYGSIFVLRILDLSCLSPESELYSKGPRIQ